MRIRPRKSNDEKQETELVIKLNGQVVLTKEMAKNLTILDTTVLAVSVMFLPVLFQGMLIESDNPLRKESENE
jgi:hypothetical protein